MPTKPQASASSRGVVAAPTSLLKLISPPSSHPDEVIDRLEVHMMAIFDRLDQEIGDEANDQKPGHDVHRDVIGLRFRDSAVDLILPDVIDQNRAQDARHRPCRDEPPMDRSD